MRGKEKDVSEKIAIYLYWGLYEKHVLDKGGGFKMTRTYFEWGVNQKHVSKEEGCFKEDFHKLLVITEKGTCFLKRGVITINQIQSQ